VINAPIPYSASDRFNDQRRMEHLPPSWKHWMGTEESGGDVFSRLLHACRVAMTISPV
jgi:peptide/nickel transport system permease protein